MSMNSPSILTKPLIDALLKIAKGNLEKDDYLVPALFVKFADGPMIGYALTDMMHTDDSQQRQMLITAVGKKLRDKYGNIEEAVIILPGWFVKTQETDALHIAPSEHPARQEAICIVGRNARNTRTTSVVQPFSRGKKNQLVWEKIPIAVYNEPLRDKFTAIGLLDYLFTHTRGTH